MPSAKKFTCEEWRSIVSRFESSGLSQRTFSEREGFPLSQLVYYIGKFRKEQSAEKLNFVEVAQTEQPAREGLLVELEFPGGIALRITSPRRA